MVEDQLKQALYGRASAPRVGGKRDEAGAWLFPSDGDLGSDAIAAALGRRIAALTGDVEVAERAERIAASLTAARAPEKLARAIHAGYASQIQLSLDIENKLARRR